MPTGEKLTWLTVEKSRIEGIAHGISVILHPLIMGPLVFFVIGMWGAGSPVNMTAVMLPAILATSVIPFLTVVWMVTRRKSRNIDIPEKEKRVFPFLIAVAGYGSVSVFYYSSGQPAVITAMMLIYGINTIIATGITRFWKISIHGMAAGGPLGAFYFLFGAPVLLGWILLPMITFSRVRLKAHTAAQVIAGFSLGFFLTCFQLILYVK